MAVFKNNQDKVNATENDKMLEEFFLDLGKNEVQAVVPTDKTNAHQVVDVLDYTKWVEEHLNNNAIEVKQSEIVKLHSKALEFADELKPILSPKVYKYLIEGINSRLIPEPQLLIKNHKKHKKD
eukprot:1233721-Ditylum_brightwellii.AAC.1